MKKIFKKMIISLVAVFTIIVSGCSCFYGEETYYLDGFEITMEKGLEEGEADGYDIYLEGYSVIMLAVKDEFGLVIDSSTSLSEYTKFILENNNLESSVHARENDDYQYFTYERSVGSDDFFYFATTHKVSDGFWLIQFACYTDDKEEYETRFLSWADSIEFTSTGIAV